MSAAADNPVAVHLALPKGHMQENIFKLFEDAGVKVCSACRRPQGSPSGHARHTPMFDALHA